MKSVIVNENDSNQRIDKFLHKFFKSRVPTSLIYKSIRKKRIKVNGKRADIDCILNTGDKIDMYINDEFFSENQTDFSHIKPDFGIVYEDKNIIIMDKKAGTVAHADSSGTVNTLASQLCAYLISKNEYDPDSENSFAPALCNRIDRNTSGLVIGAKNAAALKEMNGIIKDRLIEKYYLALATGIINKKAGTLTGYLFKDSKKNKVYITDQPQKGSVKIITKYKVIRYTGGNTLIEVQLVTGKTHQIRAHFASIGHPLAGDGKYGAAGRKDSGGQALHSYKITFTNPPDLPCLGYLSGKSFTSKQKTFADNV